MTPLLRFERRLLENYAWLVVVLVVLLTVSRIDNYQRDVGDWEWLLASGMMVFLVVYPISLQQPARAVGALHELRSRRVLPDTASMHELEARLHAQANRWANVGSCLAAGLMAAVWIAAFRGVVQDWQFLVSSTLVGVLAEIPLAMAAGRFSGRALCYASLGHRLRAAGIVIRLVPGHQDGRGGLAPLGRLYLTPVTLIVVIAAFLSSWILLAPFFGSSYGQWRGPYVGLLAFVMFCEAVAIFLPARGFHGVGDAYRRRIPLLPLKAAARLFGTRTLGVIVAVNGAVAALAVAGTVPVR